MNTIFVGIEKLVSNDFFKGAAGLEHADDMDPCECT